LLLLEVVTLRNRRIAAVYWFEAERCQWQIQRGEERAETGSIAMRKRARRPCFNLRVVGSSPTGGAKTKDHLRMVFLFCALPDPMDSKPGLTKYPVDALSGPGSEDEQMRRL